MMISDDAFNFLISCMQRFSQLDANFVLALRPLMHEIRVYRGQLLLSQAKVHPMIFFSISGSARELTHHSETLREETTWMWFRGDFIYTKPGFFSQQLSECSVEVMEDGIFIYMEYNDFKAFEKQFPSANRLSEIIRDHYHRLLKRYAFQLATLSNQERFDQFLSIHPTALVTLNHQHIASLLGIRDKGLDRYSGKK